MRVRVRITGRVQGVGFRYHTCHQARKLGVTGWVRNMTDGSVSAEFQGNQDTIDLMLAWCQRGPMTARVAAVEQEPCPEEHGETMFRLRG